MINGILSGKNDAAEDRLIVSSTEDKESIDQRLAGLFVFIQSNIFQRPLSMGAVEEEQSVLTVFSATQ